MELAPCPFCGETKSLSEVSVDGWLDAVAVRCENCGAQGPPCSTPIKAVDEWNKRY